MSRANKHTARRFPDIAAESRLCNPEPITFLGIIWQCSQIRLNPQQFVAVTRPCLLSVGKLVSVYDTHTHTCSLAGLAGVTRDGQGR